MKKWFLSASLTLTLITLFFESGLSTVSANTEQANLNITQPGSYNIENVSNTPAVFTPIGDKTVVVGQLLQFTVSAIDPDGDTLTYSASDLPLGANFDQENHSFSWTPTLNQVGRHKVEFKVTDGTVTVEEEVKIDVTDIFVNTAPVMAAIGNKSIPIGQSLEFTISGTDSNNDILTYSASNLPSGANFNPSTRVFSWVPSSAGTYSSIRFQVSDGSLADSEYIKITVDGPPLLHLIGSKSIPLGQSLEFTISAIDPNNDSLVYSAFNLPSGAIFDASTRTFHWKPAITQIGTHTNVHFEVSDGRFTDWEEINIIVTAEKAYLVALNNPPVLKTIGDRSTDVNQLLEFEVSATDLDGDYLTYSAFNLPTGASFDRLTRIFSWTPTPEQVADFNDIRFQVSDGIAVVSESIAITVVKSDIIVPEIGAVNASDMTMTTVVINWITSEPTSDQVEYWTIEHEFSQLKQDFVVQHSIRLTNLIPNKQYRFRIISKDHAGNLATSPEYSFTTLPAFTIGELEVNPVEADVGEEIRISVLVTNHADIALSHDLVLRIANAKEETRTVELAGGEQKRVTFTTTRYAPGEFSVNVNGITGSIMVPAPPRKVLDWPRIGLVAGGILALLVAGVGVFLLYRRRNIFVGHRIGRYSV